MFNLNFKEMKKQLLTAALILTSGIFAFTPNVEAKSAMDSNLTMEWMNTDVSVLSLDARQGFGMGGKFYLQNKATKKIEVWNETGKINEIASGDGTNITRDDAGNIIVRIGTFNTDYVSTRNELRIIPADGSAVVDIPLSGITKGRLDFWGHVKGNVLDKTTGGVLFMGTTYGGFIVEIPIIGGVQDTKNTYQYAYRSPFGIAGNITTTSLFSGFDGIEDLAILSPLITATANNSIEQMGLDEDENWVHKAFYITPGHNGCSGFSLFKLGDKKFIIYSTGSNNADGFTIAKLATKDVSTVEDADKDYKVSTKYAEQKDDGNVMYSNNAFYGNHFSIDPIDGENAYIYQYFPSGYIAKYKFNYKGGGVVSPEVNATYKVIGGNSEINIEGEATNIDVYSLNGVLISTNQTNVKCIPGLYIVKVDGKATKVAVK